MNFTRRNLPCKIVTPGLLSGLVFFTFFPPWLLSCPGLVFSKFFLSNWTINHAVVTSHQCKTRRSILFLARGSFWFVGSKEEKYYDFVNMQRLLCQTYKYYLYFLLLFEIFRPSGRVRGCLHLQAQRVWLERDFLRRKKYHQVIYCVSYSSQTPCTSDNIHTYLACIVCYCKRGVEVQNRHGLITGCRNDPHVNDGR